jgi:N-acyl-D-amino-acid deacylase
MVVLAASLLLHVSRAAPLPSKVQGDPAPAIQSALSEFQDKNDIPGLCFTVSYGGKLLYSFQRGYANKATGAHFTPSTRISIASVSKVPTALAMLHLLDAKQISLDDPAMRYFKVQDLPAKRQISGGNYPKITFRNLLEHTAGFGPEFNPWSRPEVAKAFGSKMPSTARENVVFGLRKPLTYAPGSRYLYTNFDYLVLGRLIEDLSGQPYEQYVDATVLEPLGMKRTVLRRSQASRQYPDEAHYYEQPVGLYPSVFAADGGKQVPMMYGGAAYEEADSSAGWVADSLDLARLISSFRTGKVAKILSPRMQMEIIRRPEYAGDVRSFTALGLDVEVAEDGSGVAFHHGGDVPGASSFISSNFAGVCMTLVMNKGITGRDLNEELHEILFDLLTIEDWSKRKPLFPL